jgi:hypothetical protein
MVRKIILSLAVWLLPFCISVLNAENVKFFGLKGPFNIEVNENFQKKAEELLNHPAFFKTLIDVFGDNDNQIVQSLYSSLSLKYPKLKTVVLKDAPIIEKGMYLGKCFWEFCFGSHSLFINSPGDSVKSIFPDSDQYNLVSRSLKGMYLHPMEYDSSRNIYHLRQDFYITLQQQENELTGNFKCYELKNLQHSRGLKEYENEVRKRYPNSWSKKLLNKWNNECSPRYGNAFLNYKEIVIGNIVFLCMKNTIVIPYIITIPNYTVYPLRFYDPDIASLKKQTKEYPAYLKGIFKQTKQKLENS